MCFCFSQQQGLWEGQQFFPDFVNTCIMQSSITMHDDIMWFVFVAKNELIHLFSFFSRSPQTTSNCVGME